MLNMTKVQIPVNRGVTDFCDWLESPIFTGPRQNCDSGSWRFKPYTPTPQPPNPSGYREGASWTGSKWHDVSWWEL